MNLPNYKDYAFFDYVNNPSDNDDFQLGDVVIKELDWDGSTVNEIGVIIQVHNQSEFRTDMFGNCGTEEIRLATAFEIENHRPEILTDKN